MKLKLRELRDRGSRVKFPWPPVKGYLFILLILATGRPGIPDKFISDEIKCRDWSIPQFWCKQQWQEIVVLPGKFFQLTLE